MRHVVHPHQRRRCRSTPLYYFPVCNNDVTNCIVAIDICAADALSMSLCVAIFRNRFDDDIVAPNIDAQDIVVAAAALDEFDAAIALARAVLATNNVALVVVDCTMMRNAATMRMMLMPTLLSPLQTTFDCCENLIGPSEMTKSRKINEI